MMFESYSSGTVARVFFNGYFFGSIFLSLTALYGFISGAGVSSTLFGFMYLVIVSLLSRNKCFRRNGFSILLCFFSFLYLNIPTAFILFEGGDYNFGGGLATIPFSQSDYQQSLPLVFTYLSVLWVAVWLGIVSAGNKIQKNIPKYFSSVNLSSILLVGVIVLIVTWFDNQTFIDVVVNDSSRGSALLAFVFFDHAYMVMAGLILLLKQNEGSYNANPRKATTLTLAIFIAFTLLFLSNGSKAAILAGFILIIFLPFAAFREYPYTQVSFPSIKFLVGLIFLAPLLFYLALIQRLSLSAGIPLDLSTLLLPLYEVDTNVIYDITKQILYRLSWGGIDRFSLIVQSFPINVFDYDYAGEFFNYLVKNTLNLLLPGTPFPESYAPSSQLFSQVIHKGDMGGEIDTETLIRALNTQPYTIFGVSVIMFGFAAPIVLYLSTFAYISIFNKISNMLIKITMVYFFWIALSSFGLEICIGNSVHLFVSILLMYFLMKVFSQFRMRLTSIRPPQI